MSGIITQKISGYTVLFERVDDGYAVSVPTLRGCYTQGETLEEAFEMAKEAIAFYLGFQ